MAPFAGNEMNVFSQAWICWDDCVAGAGIVLEGEVNGTGVDIRKRQKGNRRPFAAFYVAASAVA